MVILENGCNERVFRCSIFLPRPACCLLFVPESHVRNYLTLLFLDDTWLLQRPMQEEALQRPKPFDLTSLTPF